MKTSTGDVSCSSVVGGFRLDGKADRKSTEERPHRERNACSSSFELVKCLKDDLNDMQRAANVYQ